jgi:hypothetical protein
MAFQGEGEVGQVSSVELRFLNEIEDFDVENQIGRGQTHVISPEGDS